MQWFPDDWGKVLLPQVPVVESIVRMTLVYLVLFAFLRIILKRESSGLGISDLLVIVLLADAVARGMAGEASSVGDVLILALTLIIWDWALNMLSYHLPWFYKLVHPEPIMIVENGEINKANARKELLTRSEIMEQLHLQGIQDVGEVKKAYIESNGEMSLIKYENNSKDDKQEQPKRSQV